MSIDLYRGFYSYGILMEDCEKWGQKFRSKLLRELKASLRSQYFIL